MLGLGKGLASNSLAHSPHLAGTRLAECFKSEPLGLIDVGSLGGVHPLAEPAAAMIQALCFEPDEEAFRALEHQYASPSPYAAVKLRRDALAGSNGERDLYVAKVPTNTSLL